MALVTHSLIVFFLLFVVSSFSLERVHALGGKDKEEDDSSCPPPPPPPCPPPPPPPCPPPPPKCPLGCVPAPCKSCKSCDKGKDLKDDDHPKKSFGGVKDDDKDEPCKDDCKPCKNHCSSCKSPSRPKSPKFPPKSSKNPPKDDDDDRKGDKDKLTDRDVRNLNDLLAIQFVLNDIFLRASLANGPRPSSSASISRKVVFQQAQGGDPQMVPQMLSEFSAISIAQVSSMLSVLQDRAVQRPQDLNVTNEVLSTAVNRAFNGSLRPDFSIDNDPTKLLLGVQSLGPGLAASVATDMLPNLQSSRAVSLVSGILPALASQDASMRTVLYSERQARVEPYNYTVGEFMQRTSSLTANLRQDSGGDRQGSAGNLLDVNILGSGIACPARNVLDLIRSLLNVQARIG